MLLPAPAGVLAGIWTAVLSLVSPESSLDHAHRLLRRTPVLDGHIDLPILVRILHKNDLSQVSYESHIKGQFDLPRARAGGLGGFWTAVYVGCNNTLEGGDWTGYTDEVRDTLEQIDLVRQLPQYFDSSAAVARSPADFRANWAQGKLSHFIGIEGGHSLGNSLATLRMYAELGTTYMTLTHTCHNAFADSCTPAKAAHGGLSHFGRQLINEMNRLGVAVDLSHTSPATQRQAIKLSQAPIIFSHSGAKAIHDHVRNVGDDILNLLKDRDAVIAVPFVAEFVKGPGQSTLSDVADHIEHIASKIGRSKVALGSDYDGAPEFAQGLEDASTYPKLLAQLIERGWSDAEVSGLTSENFLRVIDAIQAAGRDIRQRGALPDMKPWTGRHDRE